MSALNDAINNYSRLSNDERIAYKDRIFGKINDCKSIDEFMTEHRFSAGRVCPICGSEHIVRNGHNVRGIQKYKCRDCENRHCALFFKISFLKSHNCLEE